MKSQQYSTSTMIKDLVTQYVEAIKLSLLCEAAGRAARALFTSSYLHSIT